MSAVVLTVALTEQEVSTLLAGLYHWSVDGLANDPNLRSDEEHDIATNLDETTSMDGTALAKLAGKLAVSAMCYYPEERMLW